MSKTNIPEILAKFDLREADFARIRAVTPILKRQLDEFLADFYEWMAQHREYQTFFGSNPARLERVKQLQRVTWIGLLEAQIDDAWFDARRHIGAVHAHIDLPNDIYFAAVSVSNSLLSSRLRQSKAEVKDLEATIDSLGKLLYLDAFVVIDEISRINREKIAAGSKALM